MISVASTMVLARLLLDRGELQTRHGRLMIAITLVEDLAVVVLTVLLPALGSLGAGGAAGIALALGKAALIRDAGRSPGFRRGVTEEHELQRSDDSSSPVPCLATVISDTH